MPLDIKVKIKSHHRAEKIITAVCVDLGEMCTRASRITHTFNIAHYEAEKDQNNRSKHSSQEGFCFCFVLFLRHSKMD